MGHLAHKQTFSYAFTRQIGKLLQIESSCILCLSPCSAPEHFLWPLTRGSNVLSSTERRIYRGVQQLSFSSDIATASLFSNIGGHPRHAVRDYRRHVLCHAHQQSLQEGKIRHHNRRVSRINCRRSLVAIS